MSIINHRVTLPAAKKRRMDDPPKMDGATIMKNEIFVLQIFSFLEFPALRTVSKVCKDWKKTSNHPKMWSTFNEWETFPQDLKKVVTILNHPRFAQLVHLKFDKVDYNITLLMEYLFIPSSQLLGLKSLDLSHQATTPTYYLNDNALSAIARVMRLQQLNLNRYNTITDNGLLHVSSLVDLQYLNIAHCYEVTDSGISLLARLNKMQFLNLAHCPKITDEGLKHLTTLSELQYLNVEWCVRIGTSGLKFLSYFPKLQSLNLCTCLKVTDDCIANICNQTLLQYLNLSDCPSITEKGMQFITKLFKLQYLNLSRSSLTDAALQYISQLSCLQILKIGGSKNLTKDRIQHYFGHLQQLVFY